MARHRSEAQLSEDEPLLNEHQRQDDPTSTRPRFNATRWQTTNPRAIVIIAAAMKLTGVLTGQLLLIPVFRLMEDALCHVYYEDDSLDEIDELLCKVDEVQSRLAYLAGFWALFMSLTSLVVTFPYGMLADRIGRKPILLASGLGIIGFFGFQPALLKWMQPAFRRNPYLMLVGCLFQLFGGGVAVYLNMLYAVAADVSTEKEKATSFLYLTFGATTGGLLGPLLVGLLMTKYGPWVPICISLSCLPLLVVALVFIPETLPRQAETERTKEKFSLRLVRQQFVNGVRDLIRSLDMIKNINIPLILVIFFFQEARISAYGSTLAQYTSKHFGWKLGEVTVLLSPIGVLNLVVLAVLPSVSNLLLSPRFGFSIFGKDLFLTRASTVIVLVGGILQGFSHDIVTFMLALFFGTLGAAASPLARAAVTHYVAPEFTSRLYALIGIFEILGSFLAGPMLAWLFDVGLKKKGLLIGLPWFYIGLLSGISWLALWFVRPPTKHTLLTDDNYEDGGDATAS